MRKLIIFFSMCTLLLIERAAAQKQSFGDRWTLRKSFSSKNDKAEAASLILNKPKESGGSWAANMAVGFNLLPKNDDIITLDPYIEFHKNTLVTKKQDSREIGLSLQWQTTKFGMGSKSWSPLLILSEKYNEDREKGNNSIRGNAYLSMVFKGKRFGFFSFIVPNQVVQAGDVFDFQYTPYIGLEHENRTLASSALAKGHIYRYLFRISPEISLFPNDPTLRGRIVLSADYQFRKDFSKNVQEITYNRHEYFTAGVSYAFYKDDKKKKSAAVGFDFINGEDPTSNFERQSYYALSLKIKL